MSATCTALLVPLSAATVARSCCFVEATGRLGKPTSSPRSDPAQLRGCPLRNPSRSRRGSTQPGFCCHPRSEVDLGVAFGGATQGRSKGVSQGVTERRLGPRVEGPRSREGGVDPSPDLSARSAAPPIERRPQRLGRRGFRRVEHDDRSSGRWSSRIASAVRSGSNSRTNSGSKSGT